jgi:hypothetical protein
MRVAPTTTITTVLIRCLCSARSSPD